MLFYRGLGVLARACESMSRKSNFLIPMDVLILLTCAVALWIGWPETYGALSTGDPGSLGSPWKILALDVVFLVVFGTVAYLRIVRFVVFEKEQSLQFVGGARKERTCSPAEFQVWLTGFFVCGNRRRHFNSVPSCLEHGAGWGWSAQTKIDTSIYLTGERLRKRIDQWQLDFEPRECSRIEAGTVFFGLLSRPALRLVGAHSPNPVLIGFGSLQERENFVRLACLSSSH
jgi:hypothetical protein